MTKEEKEILFKACCMYLPYGVKGDLVNNEYFDPQINVELFRIETGKTLQNRFYDLCVIAGCYESGIEDFKPSLRPLSQLTEEIEHNGEKFVPSRKIKDILTPDEILAFEWFFDDDALIHYDLRGMPIFIMELLLEWHFDIYGLIDKGLAIPKTK